MIHIKCQSKKLEIHFNAFIFRKSLMYLKAFFKLEF